MNKIGIMSKNETIYIALVLVKDRMVQTNCLLYKISKLSIALEKSPVKNTKKEIRKIEYNEKENAAKEEFHKGNRAVEFFIKEVFA